MAEFTLAPVQDWAAFAASWPETESPFLGWHFVGAQAALRFDAPWALTVRQDGRDVPLALLNRAGGALHLNATGHRRYDAVFLEHNGLLGRQADTAERLGPALRHVLAAAPLVAGGVNDGFLAAAQQVGIVTRHQARFAPSIDLVALRGDFLASLSANARGQIKRAMRLCGADLAIARAGDTVTSLAWFEELVRLHQASWQARGQPGAFAEAEIRAFHAAVVTSGHAAGAVDILRVRAGGATLGLLYMLRQGGHVGSYQSGFAPAPDPRHKPGLVCHALAVEFYRAEGLARYDLLAGPARYKTTLAGSGGEMLHWFTLHPPGSLRARARRLAESLRTKDVLF